MTHRERREAKAEHLREWADRRDTTAAAALESIRPFTDDYAFNTQPGTFPLRRRVIATEDRAHASLRKAGAMRGRAAGIEDQLATSIYSDDPDAIEALEARLERLEGERERIKAYNASCRKGTPDPQLLDKTQRAEIVSLARVAAWQMKGGAFPSYVLSNLSGNIKRNRDRLAQVKRQHERHAASESAGGVLIETRGAYMVVTFADKPARETLDALKDAGFRWASGSWCGRAEALPEEVKP